MQRILIVVEEHTFYLCSNTVSLLDSILYSQSLKDYSLTERREKHVNNLEGLHIVHSLTQGADNTAYCGERESKPKANMCIVITCLVSHTQISMNGKRVRVSRKTLGSPIKLQGTTLAELDTERHPMLWSPVQLPHYIYKKKKAETHK